MQILLKIVYWIAVTVYLVLLLGAASGFKVSTPRDSLWACSIFTGALLYLGGSVALFVGSNSIRWRCAALALL